MIHPFIPKSFIECILFVGYFEKLCVYSNKRHTVAPILVEALENQLGGLVPSNKRYVRGTCKWLEGIGQDSGTTMQ